jgi:hypothetical protein
MSGSAILREQLQEACRLLEGTMNGVSHDQAHWQPPGSAHPIGANWAHALLSVDMSFHALLQRVTTLAEGSWAGKTGLSELPPGGGAPAAWGEWAGRVRIDLPALKSFGDAALAAADAYLASLGDEAAGQPLDLSAAGFGNPTVSWVIGTTIMNVNLHCGEISCLKGLQGLKGYPV